MAQQIFRISFPTDENPIKTWETLKIHAFKGLLPLIVPLFLKSGGVNLTDNRRVIS